LLADAGHMLTDAAALALAYAAFRFGQRLADSRRTFGYLRFEVVAGFINAITLFAIVAWIAYEAWERFQTPSPILAG
ncbi:cation transporter, partial [Acinetobacter baumannii]